MTTDRHDSPGAGAADDATEASALAGDDARVGFCAILGLPNAGKSTLLNRVLGVRLAAVSRKPQTTRNRIVGVHNVDLAGVAARDAGGGADEAPDAASDDTRGDGAARAQIIFVDTPGIQRGPGALRQYMRDQALGAAGDCDLAVLMVDVADPAQSDPERFASGDARALLDAMRGAGHRVVIALNKIDRLRDKAALLPIIEGFAELARRLSGGAAGDVAGDAAIVPISAERGDNVDALVREVASRLPRGPVLYPEDMITDRAERFLAAELIREQLFRQLGQELPYASAVVVESFRERPDRGDIAIDAVIYVERESQKGIVIGKGGRQIKQLGERARAAIGQLFGCPAHVMLRVKVAERWSQRPGGIRRMGYE